MVPGVTGTCTHDSTRPASMHGRAVIRTDLPGWSSFLRGMLVFLRERVLSWPLFGRLVVPPEANAQPPRLLIAAL